MRWRLLAWREHRERDPLLRGRVERTLVAGVRMTCDTDPGIVRQHALEPLAHLRRAVGYDDLARVQRVSDAHTAAVVERHPTRATRDVEQRVQDRPVGDRIAAVLHR